MNFLKKAALIACVYFFGVCASFGQDANALLPAVEIEKVSYVDKVVYLNVRYAPETLSVGVYQDGELLHTEMLSPDDTGGEKDSFTIPVRISNESTEFYASAISAQSQLLLKSKTLTVSRSDFEPTQPSLSLHENEVLGDTVTFSGYPDERTVFVSVLVNGEMTVRENVDPGQPFSFRAALPYGQVTLELLYENGWGVRSTVPVVVWNIGKIPDKKTFVLVDKSEFRLYFIKQGILFYVFPIALGTPKTPTHEGWWVVGKKEIMANPYSAWGVLRLLLYSKNKKGKYHFSGYAIHGTNNPSSIGKEASHGCVRLFNEDVIKLSSIVSVGTEVFIRN